MMNIMSETRIGGWDELKNYDLRDAILRMNRQFELIEAEYEGGLSVLRKEAEKLGISTENLDKPSVLESTILAIKPILMWINALKEGLRALEIRVENLEDLDKHR